MDQDEAGQARTRAARQFIEAIPFSREIGMEVVEVTDGAAEIRMAWDARLVGDPATGVIHGGAVSALMDTCCGAAVASHPEGSPATATLDLRIDYMRAATPRQAVRAKAEVYHIGRTVAFVRARAWDDRDDPPVAVAQGAFTVDRGR